MADGIFPTLVSKDRDSNAVGNPIFVQISDGTETALVDASGNLNVVINMLTPGTGATDLGKAEDAAHASGDVGVMSLAVREDSTTSLVDTDGDYAPLQVDANGSLKVVSAGSMNATEFAEDSAHTTGDLGGLMLVVRNDANTSLVDTDGDYAPLQVDNLGNLKVELPTNSETNPIFVQQAQGVSGSEVHDFDQSVAVAADTDDNHDYAVVNTTFLLREVKFASSGGMRVEIQTGPLAGLVTRDVAFIPRRGGHSSVRFDPPIEVPVASTGTVRVIRNNRQGQAQDVYSTIIGNDI